MDSTNVTLFNSICQGNTGYLSCGMDLAGKGVNTLHQFGEQYIGAKLSYAIFTTATGALISWTGQFANFLIGRRALSAQLATLQRHKVSVKKDSLQAALTTLQNSIVTTRGGQLLKKELLKVFPTAIQQVGAQKSEQQATQIVKDTKDTLAKEVNDRLLGETSKNAKIEINNLKNTLLGRVQEAEQGGARSAGDSLSLAKDLSKKQKTEVNSLKPSLVSALSHGLCFTAGVHTFQDLSTKWNWTAFANNFSTPFARFNRMLEIKEKRALLVSSVQTIVDKLELAESKQNKVQDTFASTVKPVKFKKTWRQIAAEKFLLHAPQEKILELAKVYTSFMKPLHEKDFAEKPIAEQISELNKIYSYLTGN